MTRSREMSHLLTNLDFQFLTILSRNSNMLHFDADPIKIEHLVTEFWRICQYEKQYKQKNLDIVFANISRSISPTSYSFLLIMSRVVARKFSVPGGLWRKTLCIWLICTKMAKLIAGRQHWNCWWVLGSLHQWWALPPAAAHCSYIPDHVTHMV